MEFFFIDNTLRRYVCAICSCYVIFLLVWQCLHCTSSYFQNFFIYLHFVVAKDTVLLSSKTKRKLFKWCHRRFRSQTLKLQVLKNFRYAQYFQFGDFTISREIVLYPAMCFFTIWKIGYVACLKFQFLLPG